MLDLSSNQLSTYAGQLLAYVVATCLVGIEGMMMLVAERMVGGIVASIYRNRSMLRHWWFVVNRSSVV